jgi:maltooligosyltrehalose trehalohydrolase
LPKFPLLFQGEEYAASTPFLYFADHEDAEMAAAVSEGRKREFAAFGFGEQEIANPEDRATFERSKLNWQEVGEGYHKEMLDWYRALIHLRRTSTWLNDGDRGHTKVHYDDQKHWIRMDRGGVQVFVNLGKDAASFELPQDFNLALSSRDGVARVDNKILVPATTLAIFATEQAP